MGSAQGDKCRVVVSTGHSTEEGGAAQSQSGAAKPSTVRAEPLYTSGGAKCRVHHETWVLPPEQPPHGSETDLDQLPPPSVDPLYCTVQGEGPLWEFPLYPSPLLPPTTS